MQDFDFSPLYRSSIGFDSLIDLLESSQEKSNVGYPPYNIELVNENHYRIVIAVSGFSEDELEITTRNNLLFIKGKHKKVSDDKHYLYKGVDERDFERQFQLAEHIKIKGAQLLDGLLSIELERTIPETLKPKKIEIHSKKSII